MKKHYLTPGNRVFYKGKSWKVISEQPGGFLVIRRWPKQLVVHKNKVF